MKPLSLRLAALVVSIGRVLAGSRAFQPNLSAARLDRRSWVFDTDRNRQMIWPNRQIRYCFEDDDAADALRTPLEEADKLWHRTGLGSEFTIAEVGRDECRDHRQDRLLVRWSGDDGAMATTVGLPSADSSLREPTNDDPEKRPKMVLTTSVHMGMLDQVINFAHELGHAWGLYHEHQNPNFWSSGTISEAKGGTVFGPENHNNWKCENLKDYEEKVNNGGGEPVHNPGYDSGFGPRLGPQDLCRDYTYAADNKFTAADYLPMPASRGVGGSDGKTGDDVDWDSIMLCE